MRPWTILVLIVLAAISNLAHGRTVTRQVGSGKVSWMWGYGNVQKDCSPERGIIKLQTRPKHGKVSKRNGLIPIIFARFPEMAPCRGRLIDGVQVYYASDPGFHGADSFSIEVMYPGHPADIDTFTVRAVMPYSAAGRWK
jgi:hypothetical protein